MRAQITAHRKALYARSPLQQLNQARRRTAILNPLRTSSCEGKSFLAQKPGRSITLADLHNETEQVDALSGEREPFLLVNDPYNPGRYVTVWIAASAKGTVAEGKYLCDTAHGLLLLHPDTLIYWQ